MKSVHLYFGALNWYDKHIKHMIHFGNLPAGDGVNISDYNIAKIPVADEYYMWSWENNYFVGLYIMEYITKYSNLLVSVLL